MRTFRLSVGLAAAALLAVTAGYLVVRDTSRVSLLAPLPNSDFSLRCAVNVETVFGFPREQWTDIALITDFSVPAGLDAAKTYQAGITTFVSAGAGLVGTYISSQDVKDSSEWKHYPAETLEAKLFIAWLRPDPVDEWGAYHVALRIVEARQALAKYLVQAGKDRRRPILYLDNMRHPYMLPEWGFTWGQVCGLLHDVNVGLDRKSHVIANVAGHVGLMSNEDLDMLAKSCDGASFEMAWDSYLAADRDRSDRAFEAYRRLLGRDFCVIFIPVGGELEREAQFLAGLAMILRQPGDRIFVAWPLWKPIPEWEAWSRTLKEPRGIVISEYPRMLRQHGEGDVVVDLQARTARVE